MKLNKYFGVKKGELLIRHVVIMMLLVSSILVLASTFVTEMAGNYGNTEMEAEYLLNNISMTSDTGLFGDLRTDVSAAEDTLTSDDSGLWSLVFGESKKAVTSIFFTFITGPTQIGNLVKGAMVDMGVDATLANVIKYIVAILLWVVVIFGIITAALQGAKV